MKKTLDGSDFLIKDLTMDNNRILIFTTIANVIQLEQSTIWIIDGTFKTVPSVFKQLYTIHEYVRENENSRIMPLVYSLMSSKSEQCYQMLFQDLIEFSNEHDIDLQPQFVLMDFEIAAINAIRTEFPGVQNKCCHFHLSQNLYQKVQEFGLATLYGNDENFSILIKHIPALAFLSHSDIPEAFDELRTIMPEEANIIMKWFEIYYIRERIRHTTRNGNVIHSDLLFLPSL